MKTWLRILCALLCAALICGMPFYLPAPMMIQEAKDTLLNEDGIYLHYGEDEE